MSRGSRFLRPSPRPLVRARSSAISVSLLGEWPAQPGDGRKERELPWMPWIPKDTRDFIELAGHLEDPRIAVARCQMCGTEHRPGPCPVCASRLWTVRKARGANIN